MKPSLFSGIEEFSRRLDSIARAVADEAEQLVTEEAEALKESAQALAPYRTGELRDSAYLRVERNGDAVVAEVGFSAPHAIRVHELTDLVEHDEGEAKFLERPLFEGASATMETARRRLAARIGTNR